MGDKNQLKHLLAVHLTIHLYIEDEVMLPGLRDTIPISITGALSEDEVELEFTL